jgi:hypothetical protein
MRHAMGIAVFSGMLGVTLFGLLLTPLFYVLVRKLAPPARVPMQAATAAPAKNINYPFSDDTFYR